MLREGFILFEKGTDVLHISKRTSTDSPTGFASQINSFSGNSRQEYFISVNTRGRAGLLPRLSISGCNAPLACTRWTNRLRR